MCRQLTKCRTGLYVHQLQRMKLDFILDVEMLVQAQSNLQDPGFLKKLNGGMDTDIVIRMKNITWEGTDAFISMVSWV